MSEISKQKLLDFLKDEKSSCRLVGDWSDRSIIWECNRIEERINAGMFDASGESELSGNTEQLELPSNSKPTIGAPVTAIVDKIKNDQATVLKVGELRYVLQYKGQFGRKYEK